MSKRYKGFELVGKTSDGQFVVAGVFKMYDTIGLPLDILFCECAKDKIMPSWNHFYEEATKSGWKHKTIISRLSETIFEAWGKEFRDTVIDRLQQRGL